jgi:hypothetical protein
MNSKRVPVFYKALLTSIFAVNAVVCFAANVEVPDILKAPADQNILLEAKAEGVQIYKCETQKNDSLAFEWKFIAPEADLYNTNGEKIAHHYAGPTWESNDGSKVVGEVKEKYSVPDAKAVPWLLLGAKSSSAVGTFAKVTSIQRINTEGGQAPAEVCNQTLSGKEVRIPYKAVYRFYVLKK